MARRAAKRDKNEGGIISALRSIGCYVIQETNVDLWVLSPQGVWTPIEVKTKQGRLTDYQIKLHADIESKNGYTIPIIRTEEEAINFIQELDGLT